MTLRGTIVAVAAVAGLVLGMGTVASAKTGRTYYTDADVAAVRARAKDAAYAKDVDAILKKAAVLVNRSDEELWAMVPEADFPRALNVRFGFDCPVHGKEVFKKGGHYPWIMSPEKPFKVECPIGHEVYPSNDFYGAWTAAGGGGAKVTVDKTQKYADDGSGWVDDAGNRYWFVAHYNFWEHWRHTIIDGIEACGQAYLITGDEKYAHVVAVLLARVSQVYPKMDYRSQAYHSGKWPAGINGRILDYIWENSTAKAFAIAYDTVYPTIEKDEKLRAIAGAKGVADVKAAIERDILQVQVGDIFEKKIWGNKFELGTLAAMALVLGNDDPAKGKTSKEMAEWILTGGGELEYTLYNGFDRDGIGGESSPGYSSIWAVSSVTAAEDLARMGLKVSGDPRWRRICKGIGELRVLDDRTPHIGDAAGDISGSPRVVSRVLLRFAVEQFKDADAAAMLLKSKEKEPLLSRASLDEKELKELAKGATFPDAPYTRDVGGYGLAILELNDGAATRSAALYYGSPNAAHGHLDRLNLSYAMLGRDVIGDLGYPSHWGPVADWWVQNTPSHLAVMVDGKAQQTKLAGELTRFADLDGLKVAEAQGRRAWGSNVKDYRRMVALLDTGEKSTLLIDAYVVEGGTWHDYSFHGLSFGKFATDAKVVKEQGKGTLAGEDIEYDVAPKVNKEAGYQYMMRPRWHDTSGEVLKATWTGDKGLDMAAWFPKFAYDEAIVTDTIPPVKPGYPDSMPYIVLRQKGRPVSLFVTVTEVGRSGEGTVKGVRRVGADDAKAGGVVIEMKSGKAWKVYVNMAGKGVKYADGVAGDVAFGVMGPRKYAVGEGKMGDAVVPAGGEWVVKSVDYAKGRVTVEGPGMTMGKNGTVVMVRTGETGASYTVRSVEGSEFGFGEVGLITGRFAGAWDAKAGTVVFTERTMGVYNQFEGKGTFVGMFAVSEDMKTARRITGYDRKANTFTIEGDGEALRDVNGDGKSYVYIADVGPGAVMKGTGAVEVRP